MTLGGVTFVAQERHGPTDRLRERIEGGTLSGEILPEVREVARKIAILPQPMTDMAWCAEGALVLIADAGCGQNLRERVLGEAFTA